MSLTAVVPVGFSAGCCVQFSWLQRPHIVEQNPQGACLLAKSRPTDTMRRSTAEERAVNRGTPRPIPIAHYDFSSRLAPQPIYAAPAPGGPAARPWSRRAHPTATWSPGVARPPCWPTASAAGRHTDGAQRPHSAPRPIPTMTAGILTNASPSTIKTLRYRSTPYARPSPSQFSRPAAVAAATRSLPSAQEVADVLIPDRKLANDNDTNSILGSPSSWTPMPDDPMQVLIVEVPDGPERAEALRLFQLTAPSSVRVLSVCRVQNLALWYSFVVKRQTMLMREKSLPNAAVEHYEQRVFHGCPAHLVDRIAQQGFNRSFTGATSGRALYGKGVYFARDARYSMSTEYSPPDANGVQNMFLVRAVVCKGVKDALTPVVRYENQLYDSTVDDVQRPSIYVTYNDAQVYPDILIKFSQ